MTFTTDRERVSTVRGWGGGREEKQAEMLVGPELEGNTPSQGDETRTTRPNPEPCSLPEPIELPGVCISCMLTQYGEAVASFVLYRRRGVSIGKARKIWQRHQSRRVLDVHLSFIDLCCAG